MVEKPTNQLKEYPTDLTGSILKRADDCISLMRMANATPEVITAILKDIGIKNPEVYK